MSALDGIPDNVNYLSGLNFRFILRRSPHLMWFIQEFNLPGVQLPSIPIQNPLVRIPVAGDHLEFERLSVTFKVDEDLQTLLEMQSWIRGLGFPDDHSQYKVLADRPKYSNAGLTSEIDIFILDSTKRPNYIIKFNDALPIALSGVRFATTSSTTAYPIATVDFDYRSYDIEKIT